MNRDKLASTVLYLLRGCSAKLGLTSLLKMIYFADYRHFQEHLSPISGARYVAMERGPVVEDYWKVFEDLEGQGLVRTEDVPMAGHPGHPKKEFVALAEPDEDLFSETEIKVLDDVIHEYGWRTGTALSEITHREGGPWSFIWDAKRPNRPIPYVAFRWLANLPNEKDTEEAKVMIGSRDDVAKRIAELNAG